MKRVILGLTVFLLCIGNANAFKVGTPWSWGPGDPNYNPAADIDIGTIDTTDMLFGTYLGRQRHSFGETTISSDVAGLAGTSGAGAPHPWDDNWASGGSAATNGNALDGLWIQNHNHFDGAGNSLHDGGWFDLGERVTTFTLFLSQDHGPYPAEAIECTVYGSNTPGELNLNSSTTLIKIYLDGWREHNDTEDWNGNGWQSDDANGVWKFDNAEAYQYIFVEGWGLNPLQEPEIDAVGIVQTFAQTIPEPTSMILLTLAVLGLLKHKGSRKN